MEVAFISRFDNRKPKQPDDLVNERVRFKEVLVIDQNGDQLGVKSSREALDIAYDANLDLVVEECAEVGQIEKPAKLEGRTLTAILAPKKKK